MKRAPLDLLVLAELNPDVIVDCGSAQPAFGQVETEVDGATMTLGSSGAITAASAAALGLRVAICGVVGEDAAGRFTLDALRDLAVDTSLVIRSSEVSTGMTVVLNGPHGDRALLTFPGAMAALRAEDVEPVSARHVHVSSIYLQRALQSGLPALLARARAEGATTSIDTGWDPQQEWTAVAPMLDEVDYLFPNLAELEAITAALGLAATGTALSALGPTVVLKRGGDGASSYDGEHVLDLPTSSAVPVDTTGAGDNFNAGFLHGLLSGRCPAECLAQAVAAGAISVQGRGGTGRLATPAELGAAAERLVTQVHDPDRKEQR